MLTDKLKLIVFGAIVALIIGVILFLFLPKAGANEKVNVCHATASEEHPFQVVKVDKDAWDEHTSAHSEHEEDFLYEGNADDPKKDSEWCENNTPEEEPKDYCDTVEGTQPEDYDCPKEEEPSCEETQTCEETPEVVYGLPGDGLSDSKGYSPATCGGIFPDKPIIREELYKVTGATSAHFEFWPVKADSYVVEYGYSKDKLDYGIPYLGGDSTGFEVSELKAGFSTLFARVTAKLNECYTSSEIAN